jgi:hypothetical protein
MKRACHETVKEGDEDGGEHHQGDQGHQTISDGGTDAFCHADAVVDGQPDPDDQTADGGDKQDIGQKARECDLQRLLVGQGRAFMVDIDEISPAPCQKADLGQNKQAAPEQAAHLHLRDLVPNRMKVHPRKQKGHNPERDCDFHRDIQGRHAHRL